ncbi:MAG: ABC transporter substrate-binding protein [Acidimicrobiales bacterium]
MSMKTMGRAFPRRRFLRGATLLGAGALGGGGPLLAACGDSSSSSSSAGGGDGGLDALTTQLVWIKNVEFAGWWVALLDGHYTDEGIDPEFLPGDTAAAEAVVAGGGAPIGISGVTSRITDAIAEGSDFVIYGVQYQNSPDAILSLPDNPIQTPEDIVGKRIGVQEGAALDVDAILLLAGLPVEWEPVRVGFDPDPLVQGDVDGYFCYAINQPITLDLQGIDNVVVTLSDLGNRQYGNLLFGERRFVEENHDLLVRHTRATIRGWEINNADPELGLAASLEVGQDLALDEEQQRRQNEAQIPLMESDTTRERGLFWVDKEEIGGPIYEALGQTRRTDLPDVDRLVDVTILEDVLQSGPTVGS